MWLQWLELPGFRGVTSERLTHLHFPEHQWRRFTDDEREGFLADWLRRSRQPGFDVELDAALRNAMRWAGEDRRIHERELELTLWAIDATLWWRVRKKVATTWPLRALLARRHELAERASIESRSESIGWEHGHGICSSGSFQRHPSSSAGSQSWVTA